MDNGYLTFYDKENVNIVNEDNEELKRNIDLVINLSRNNYDDKDLFFIGRSLDFIEKFVASKKLSHDDLVGIITSFFPDHFLFLLINLSKSYDGSTYRCILNLIDYITYTKHFSCLNNIELLFEFIAELENVSENYRSVYENIVVNLLQNSCLIRLLMESGKDEFIFLSIHDVYNKIDCLNFILTYLSKESKCNVYKRVFYTKHCLSLYTSDSQFNTDLRKLLIYLFVSSFETLNFKYNSSLLTDLGDMLLDPKTLNVIRNDMDDYELTYYCFMFYLMILNKNIGTAELQNFIEDSVIAKLNQLLVDKSCDSILLTLKVWGQIIRLGLYKLLNNNMIVLLEESVIDSTTDVKVKCIELFYYLVELAYDNKYTQWVTEIRLSFVVSMMEIAVDCSNVQLIFFISKIIIFLNDSDSFFHSHIENKEFCNLLVRFVESAKNESLDEETLSSVEEIEETIIKQIHDKFAD